MNFEIPQKKLRSKNDLLRFQSSETREEYVNFINTLCSSTEGTTFRINLPTSVVVDQILEFLDFASKLVDEVKPLETRSRFGNEAFIDWHSKLEQSFDCFCKFIPNEARIELDSYILSSFGNFQRIDYGTAHEMNFACWLFCLYKMKFFDEEHFQVIVLKVFRSYIQLVRKLQIRYWLEPAGSHGVWGLDDYNFLPFLFGAYQLKSTKQIRPKDIHNKEYVEDFSRDFFYFEAIQFVNQIKTVSIQWHSPILNDISQVKTWSKVADGLFKMYLEEVLNKLPVMQHFLFGSFLKFEESGDQMEHDCNLNCCILRVPASIGSKGLRDHLIPFD